MAPEASRSTSTSSTTGSRFAPAMERSRLLLSAREASPTSTPRSWAGCAASGWKPGSGTCRPVLANACAGQSSLHFVPLAIPRQGEPGALLLGQLRPRGHALLGAHGAAAPQRFAQSRSLGDAGSLLARSQQLRLLAGQRRLRPTGLLQLCLSRAGGFR